MPALPLIHALPVILIPLSENTAQSRGPMSDPPESTTIMRPTVSVTPRTLPVAVTRTESDPLGVSTSVNEPSPIGVGSDVPAAMASAMIASSSSEVRPSGLSTT
ncbi:MAG: hypothetical protein BWY85_02162 [Firmicutes bacterium ADurb.Bin506]|nr:MAG: hypothetical protein BWY85_02162 [Firmicutes bacterium ADurb.Bin506]